MSKILIAEDENDLLEIIVITLENAFPDFTFVTAISGNKAIEILKQDASIDLVLSDYKMYDGTGGDILKFIDSCELKTPFLLLSGGSVNEYAEFSDRQKDQVFKGAMDKPFDCTELVSLIKTTLQETKRETNRETAKEANKVKPEKPSTEPEYFKISSSLFENMQCFNIDAYTQLASDKYVQILKKDERNNASQFKHFADKGIQNVYIKTSDSSAYLIEIQKIMKEKMRAAQKSESIKFGGIEYEFSKVAIGFIGVSELVCNYVNEQILKTSNNLSTDAKFYKLWKNSVDKESYLSSHALMCSYVSIFILEKIGLGNERNKKKVILASLFHDISLESSSEAKIKLYEHESLAKIPKIKRDEILSHPLHSCEIIEEIVSVGEEDTFQIIKDHHERPDGSGQPRGIDYSEIRPLSAVLIFAHEVTSYFYESEFNLTGLFAAIESLPAGFRLGSFKRPYEAFHEALKELD